MGTVVEPWTCPTCKTTIDTRYCPTCGERSLDERELTMHGLAAQIFNSLTSVDSTLLRSFGRLFSSPGELTVAYLQGQRKPYLGPVPLFLMANVLFFAVESLLGGTVFTAPLASHLSTQPWSPLAETLLDNRVSALNTSVAAFTPIFDRALALHARSLIILMALAFALFPSVIFHRRNKPLVTHAVFSLHLYAFLLPLFCVATAIQAADGWLGGPGFAWRLLDNALAIALLLAAAVYLHGATARVYGAHGVSRIVQVLVLTIGVGAIVLGYRFWLFLLTLYTA